MATIALSTVAIPASTSSSAAPASTSPSFAWQPIGQMYTCGATNIRWTYTGSSSPLTLNITNINVTQQAPLSSAGASATSLALASASAATASATSPSLLNRQFNGYGGSYLPPVNEFIIAGIDPTVNNFTWTSVNVPQGWYEIFANVQNTAQATSSSFYVQNGSITSCIPQFAVGIPVPSTSASSSASHVPVATSSPSSAPSGHSHAGAIAGGVVGGLAFLGIFAAIFFFFIRRRPSLTRLRDEDGGGRRWSQLSFRKLLSGNNTGSSIQKTSNLQAEQTVIGSDEEISTVGHEKAIAIAAAQVLPHPSPQQPTRSQSFRTSAQSYRDPRVTANPERPGSRASQGAHPGEAIPLEPTNLQHSPSLTSPRRKPAPRYDDATDVGVRDGHSSSQTTLDPVVGGSANGSPDSVHILQHKSSFGAVRPMRVMISDPPAAVPP